MTYLKHNELTYELWHSLVMTAVEYYNYLGWENLSQQETELFLSHGLKIRLDKKILTMLHNNLERRKKIINNEVRITTEMVDIKKHNTSICYTVME